MIEHHLAFELNSKSMYLYDHEHLYLYALGLVKETGCHKYSIGSDGHKREYFRLQLDRIQQILEEDGIGEGEII